jgi:anti-anti-sigma regulatory factor
MLDIDYIIDFISQIEKILNLIIDYKIRYNPDLLQFLEISKSQIGYMIEFFALNGDVELEARLQKVASNVLQKLSTLTQNSMLSEEESEELVAAKMAETLPDITEPTMTTSQIEEEDEPITVAVQEVQEVQTIQETNQTTTDEVAQESIDEIDIDNLSEIAQEESEEVGDDFFGDEDKTSPFPSSFTISDIDKVKESFTNQLDMTGDFVVNFSAVNEIDTAGMQLIVAMKKYCDTEGIEYKVTNPSLALTSAFEKLNIELGA